MAEEDTGMAEIGNGGLGATIYRKKVDNKHLYRTKTVLGESLTLKGY